jgi:putative radical SAM enzyme (TIGR03279 family)
VCPGINDGPVLKQTIDDLLSLYPACLSFAVVPVGLTRFRSGLDDLKMFDRASAKALLDLVNPIRAFCKGHFGSNFIFPSDEMYIMAGEELPEDSEYEDYSQIDNGVGLCRSLITEFEYAYEDLPGKYKRATPGGRKLLAACGVSFKPILEKLLKDHPVSGVSIRVKEIINNFFGDTVTVSGLITGGDLISQLEHEDCEAVLITETMLRHEDMRFLDDMLLDEAEAKLGKPIIPVGRTGEEFLEAIKAFSDA